MEKQITSKQLKAGDLFRFTYDSAATQRYCTQVGRTEFCGPYVGQQATEMDVYLRSDAVVILIAGAERCEHCGRELNPLQTVWLELSITDGRYYSQLPAGHESQGAFPFGAACAGWADGKTFIPYHNK